MEGTDCTVHLVGRNEAADGTIFSRSNLKAAAIIELSRYKERARSVVGWGPMLFGILISLSIIVMK